MVNLKINLKVNPKVFILIILLIVGGVLNMMMSADLGIIGSGFIPSVLSLGSILAVYGVWKLKPEAWLGCIAVYALLIVIVILVGAYIQLGFNIFMIIYALYVREVFGIKLRKEAPVEEKELPTIPKLDKDEIDKLTKKIEVDIKALKCPKCKSDEIVICEDASAICQSCKYGIMDVRGIA